MNSLKFSIEVRVLASLLIFSLINCQENLDSKDRDVPSLELHYKSNKSKSLLPVFSNESERLNFLQGKFNPSRYLSSYYNPGGDGKKHYLLPEVLEGFNKMVRAYEEEIQISNPNYNQKIFIVSSFRDFESQKSIWEGKFKGERKMRLPIQGKRPQEIVSLILEFSSAPGASRHHWGTDFDINSLQNSYSEKGGKGEVLYNWLRENAIRFGFCQPYNELQLRNFKGYNEEKWHWSYKPTSSILQRKWIDSYNASKISITGFQGAEAFSDLALTYVSSVNKDCH